MSILKELRGKIANLEAEICKIQENCSHPDAIMTPGESTCGCCGDDDTYWTEHFCRLCEKKWYKEAAVR